MIQIFNYGLVDQDKIFARVVPEVDVEAVVAQIIADVRKGKDRAVIEYCRRFDRMRLSMTSTMPPSGQISSYQSISLSKIQKLPPRTSFSSPRRRQTFPYSFIE